MPSQFAYPSRLTKDASTVAADTLGQWARDLKALLGGRPAVSVAKSGSKAESWTVTGIEIANAAGRFIHIIGTTETTNPHRDLQVYPGCSVTIDRDTVTIERPSNFDTVVIKLDPEATAHPAPTAASSPEEPDRAAAAAALAVMREHGGAIEALWRNPGTPN